jgi:hypothetical protein
MDRQVVLLDVDNTLFDFSIPWYLEIQKVYHGFPDPHRWNRWDLTTFNFFGKQSMYKFIDAVHARQLDFYPYTQSSFLTQVLMQNYYVVIATHRSKKYESILWQWLDRWKITFDEISCSDNKMSLCNDYNVKLIIDDSPVVLSQAEEIGVEAFGLSFPWNKGHNTFESIDKIIEEVYKIN